MKRKLQSITSKLLPVTAVLLLLALWQTASAAGLISRFLLPSPLDVAAAFAADFPLLMENAKVTLLEALIGLAVGVLVGFVTAVMMDCFEWLYRAVYPLIVLTQTVPTVAVAPLLVLW